MDSRDAGFLCVGVLLGAFAATAGFLFFYSREPAPETETSARVLKLAHTSDSSHLVHKALEHFASRVGELSDGALQVVVVPNGQLGSEAETIEQVRRGVLEITKASTPALEEVVPELAIFSVPYLFRDDNHFWKVIHDAIGEELLAAGESRALRGLCFYGAGARSFFTVETPIRSPEDLRGLTIRAEQGSAALELVEAFGGSPNSEFLDDLATALRQGRIDGAEDNLPGFVAGEYFEVCRHLSLDEHTRAPDMLLIAADIWQYMTPQEREWFQQAANESSAMHRELWAQETATAADAVRRAGVSVHEPDRSLFAEKFQAVRDENEDAALGELLERVREVR